MALQRIRDDVCYLLTTDPLARFEVLECGCRGRRLGRLLPTRFRHRPPTLDLDEDRLTWMHTWPEGPTHAQQQQPTWRKPPARSRHCGCPDTEPDHAFRARLRIDSLVLHRYDDRCAPCGT